jgi:uncharacterized LabA/DUF88 family protein
MPNEPATKRAKVFVDGQNLFHSAKEAFGYSYPNYDVARLASWVCRTNGWELISTHFYTGIPDPSENPFWSQFWVAKLSAMGRQGVSVFSRPLRYRNETVRLSGGVSHTFLVGQEKGIDVRIAVDIVRAAMMNECDVVVVFSQDQDLSEVADEIRTIARNNGRWLKIACAFPDSPTLKNRRGINKTDWIRINRSTYDSCLDTTDHRPKKG